MRYLIRDTAEKSDRRFLTSMNQDFLILSDKRDALRIFWFPTADQAQEIVENFAEEWRDRLSVVEVKWWIY